MTKTVENLFVFQTRTGRLIDNYRDLASYFELGTVIRSQDNSKFTITVDEKILNRFDYKDIDDYVLSRRVKFNNDMCGTFGDRTGNNIAPLRLFVKDSFGEYIYKF